MTTTDPLSLTEAKRLSSNADTLLLRATRPADLETPIGAFLRLDDGSTPAYLLESVEGGERLGRYSFLGVGPRRLLQVRDGQAAVQTRPIEVDTFDPSLHTETPDLEGRYAVAERAIYEALERTARPSAAELDGAAAAARRSNGA